MMNNINNNNGVKISEVHLDKVCKLKKVAALKKSTTKSIQKEKNDLVLESMKKIKSIKKQKIKDHINLDDLLSPQLSSSPLKTSNQKPLVPSIAENYLEMQRNIRHSNPILWLIRNKNRQNQFKEKNQVEPLSPLKMRDKATITPIVSHRPNPLPKLQIESTEKKEPKSKIEITSNDSGIFGHIIHWKKGDIIHDGEHSVLYKAFNITTGNVFVVKEYKSDKFLNKKSFYNEIKIYRIVHHCNIVNFIGGEVFNNTHYIYLDFVPGGDLRSFIGKFGGFKEILIKNYIKQIISVIEYMNAQGLIYANLSLSHLLIDCDGLLKFVDFSAVQSKKNIYKNRKIDLKVNFDLKCLGKVVKEVIDLGASQSHIQYSKLLVDYCDFLNGNEMNLISFREIKNHPFLK